MSIRRIKPKDYPALSDFLYAAIWVPSDSELPPRSIIEKPELALYIDGFGGKDDVGLVAKKDGKIVGAAWTRLIHGFGYVDDETPELTIGVLPEYRNKGIGTKLLKNLFEVVVEKRFKRISLDVKKDNPAVHLYERLGFTTERETDDSLVMVRELKEEARGLGIGLGMGFGAGLGAIAAAITGQTDAIAIWIPIGMILGVGAATAWYESKKKRNA
ncbi:MAG: GNAT family N-acetyltransferase [Propionibacteriaceae bacterium]|nr:GNAT family N-acetyltransferase [Propionibacteriaceae bacterium]